MTVKELIEHLQTLDPTLHVFHRGYEGGLDDVVAINGPLDVALNVNEEDEWWYGSHSLIKDVDDKSNYTIVKGIIL